MKGCIATAVLVFTCVVGAAYASLESFAAPMPSVHDRPALYPDAWVPTSAREVLSGAAKTQTARYPSWIP